MKQGTLVRNGKVTLERALPKGPRGERLQLFPENQWVLEPGVAVETIREVRRHLPPPVTVLGSTLARVGRCHVTYA